MPKKQDAPVKPTLDEVLSDNNKPDLTEEFAQIFRTDSNETPPKTMEEQLLRERIAAASLPERLVRIQIELSKMQFLKSGERKGDKGDKVQYNFLPADDFFDAVAPVFSRNGVILCERIKDSNGQPVTEVQLNNGARLFDFIFEYGWMTLGMIEPFLWMSQRSVTPIYNAETLAAGITRNRKYFIRNHFLVKTGEKDLDDSAHAPPDNSKQASVKPKVVHPKESDYDPETYEGDLFYIKQVEIQGKKGTEHAWSLALTEGAMDIRKKCTEEAWNGFKKKRGVQFIFETLKDEKISVPVKKGIWGSSAKLLNELDEATKKMLEMAHKEAMSDKAPEQPTLSAPEEPGEDAF